MKLFFPVILSFSIIAGQLVKLPISGYSGPTILDLTIIFLTIFGFYKTKLSWKNPPLLFKIALFFILIGLVSLILTPLQLNFNEYLNSFFYSLRLTFYILFGWCLYSEGIPQIKYCASLILRCSAFAIATIGLLQLVLLKNLAFLVTAGWDPHYFRTVSTFLDPNFAGAFFVLSMLIIVSSIIKNYHSRLDFDKLTFILCYISLLTTFSRSSYIMFVVSFTTLAILNRSTKLFILTTLLSLGIVLGFLIYSAQITSPRNIDRTQSAKYRIGSWEQGIQIFQKSPFLGIGFNSYKFALRQYNLAPIDYLTLRSATGNDSSFLFILSTTGIVGFIIYLSFLYSLFKNNSLDVNVIAGLTGIIIHSFFVNSLFYPFLIVWFILASCASFKTSS